jgi:hypothetical protein
VFWAVFKLSQFPTTAVCNSMRIGSRMIYKRDSKLVTNSRHHSFVGHFGVEPGLALMLWR